MGHPRRNARCRDPEAASGLVFPVDPGAAQALEPGALLDDIAAVTQVLGLRAIISAGWAGRTDVTLPDRVRLVGAVDHDLLLPRCAAAVHHGGTGTTAASTRAGCPTVVCSVFCDQPWWGERITQLGVGTHVRFHSAPPAPYHGGLSDDEPHRPDANLSRR